MNDRLHFHWNRLIEDINPARPLPAVAGRVGEAQLIEVDADSAQLDMAWLTSAALEPSTAIFLRQSSSSSVNPTLRVTW